jgi:hypothetical protein
LKAERRIISKRCMLQYIPIDIFRASVKFFMGDKLRKKMEWGKRDETFFSALYCANTFTNCILKQFENYRSKMKPCTRRGPKKGKKHKRVVMAKLLTIK